MILVKKQYRHLYPKDMPLYDQYPYLLRSELKDVLVSLANINFIELEGIGKLHVDQVSTLTDYQLDYIQENYLFVSHWNRPKRVVLKEHVILDRKRMYERFIYELDSKTDSNEFGRFVSLSRDFYRDNKSERHLVKIDDLNKQRINKILKPPFYDFYGEENVEIRQVIEKGEIHIVVKYGDTTISNLNNSHPIKDLYLKFIFKSNPNIGAFSYNNILGLRTTVTESERGCGYQHSHLPHTSSYFLPFCLGGSQAGVFFFEPLNINNENTYDLIEEFLITVDHLIQFEDVDNPYIAISRIKPTVDTINKLGYIDKSSILSNKEILVKHSKISIKTGLADNTSIFLKIKSDPELIEKLPDRLKAIKSPDGKYYNYTSYMRLIRKLEISNEKNVLRTEELDSTFKGEPLIRKTIPDNLDSVNLQPELCVHPYAHEYLTKHYQTEITNIINNYVKNKKSSGIKAKAQNNYN